MSINSYLLSSLFTPVFSIIIWLFYSNHFINLVNILFYTSFIIFIIAFLILLIQEGIFDATSFGFRRLKYQLSSTKRKRMMKNDHFFNPQKVKKESYIISPWVVPKRANIRIMESARERLGIEREKMSVSVNKYGNTSAASIPLSINQELQNGKIKDDDTLVLVGFGGGLTWGAIVIKWGK